MDDNTKNALARDTKSIRDALIKFEVCAGLGTTYSKGKEIPLSDYRVGFLIGVIQSAVDELRASVD